MRVVRSDKASTPVTGGADDPEPRALEGEASVGRLEQVRHRRPGALTDSRPVPVTIRVRLGGETVWTTSADFRYSASWRKKGKIKR